MALEPLTNTFVDQTLVTHAEPIEAPEETLNPEVVQNTTQLPDITPFIQQIDVEDADTFQYYEQLLARKLISDVPLEVFMVSVRSLRAVMMEISKHWDARKFNSNDAYILCQVTQAMYDMLITGLADFPTAAREEAGVYGFEFNPGAGLVSTDVATMQREHTVAMQRAVWDFARQHPEFPAINQILIDWVQTIQASDQSTHPLYADYKALKAEFYRLFVNMNKDVPTTDSQVDIARAASIIRAMRAIGKPLRSVAVAGSGDMARFEGQLFQLLQKEGIFFEEIIAVDRVNYGAQIAETLPELHVDFHQGDILDVNAFGGKKVNMLLYPWSVFSDILPVRDSIQALHTAASLLEPGGIMIVDQAVPLGASSYKAMQVEQATHTGALGVFERSFNGADGEELWSAFNIMELESFLRDAAQAGFVPRNIGATVQEQHALVETIEADESILVREAETKENLDAMAHPIYQANGWNRMTLVLEYIGQEEALRKAKAGKSLFHQLSCTAVGEAKDGA